jgi:sugar lactone lactonase YvrE
MYASAVRGLRHGCAIVATLLLGCSASGIPGSDRCRGTGCPPELLSTGEQLPLSLVLDGGYAYWTDAAPGGLVRRVSLSGGVPETLAAVQATPGPLAIDAGHAFWIDESGTILSLALDGTSAPMQLATGPSHALAIVARDGTLYWTTGEDGLDGSVRTMPESGGAPAVLAEDCGFPLVLLLDGDRLYWVNGEDDSDDDDPDDRGRVFSLARAGGTAQMLVEDGPAAVGLARSGSELFYLTRPPTSVMQVSEAGGAATVLASLPGYANNLAVDEESVYWTSAEGGTVMKMARAGGEPEVVAAGLGRPFAIAVDEDSIYWTDLDRGTIARVAKN